MREEERMIKKDDVRGWK